MPAQERVGLHDQQGLPPATDAAGQEHQSRAVGGSAAGALHAPREHDQLLAQQGVLGDQVPLAAGEVGQRPGEDRGGGRSRSSQEAATKRMEGNLPGAGDTGWRAGPQTVPRASSQRCRLCYTAVTVLLALAR